YKTTETRTKRSEFLSLLSHAVQVFAGADELGNDLFIAHSLQKFTHEEALPAAIGAAVQELQIEGVHQVLLCFLAVQDLGCNRTCGSASGQLLTEHSLAGWIHGAIQHIAVNGGEEAGIGIAALRLEILRRSEQGCLDLLHGRPISQRLHKGI